MLAETREREPIFAFQDERHTCPGRVARVFHDRPMRSGRGTHALAVQAVRRLRDSDMPFGCIAVITDRTLDHGRRLSVSEEFRRLGQEIDAGRAEHGGFAATDTMNCRLSVQAPFDEYGRTSPSRSFAVVGSVTVDAVEIVSGGDVGDEIVVAGTDVFENAQRVWIAE